MDQVAAGHSAKELAYYKRQVDNLAGAFALKLAAGST